MASTDKGVTVTITPGGQVFGIAVDGIEIGHRIPTNAVSLFIGGYGNPPTLQLAIEPDRIVIADQQPQQTV